ncbi:hypothetical protein Tco_1532843 [Tanacetum coccineum]
MFFYLITLNLARFLNETAPQVEPPKEGKLSNAQAVEAWKHSDFLCHNYVLNGLLRMERLNLGNSPTANIKGKGDVVRSHIGGEFVSPFLNLCVKLKIRDKYIALGIEKNRALEDMVNDMFVSPGLSHGMWGKAVISATYLLDILCKEMKTGSVAGRYVKSGCTTALNVVPWETDGESVLREAMTNSGTTPPVNKMFFYLITLNLARFLNETAPQVEPPKEGKLSNAQAVQA